MKKKLIILFFILSKLILSKDNGNIPFHKELTDISDAVIGRN